MKGESDQARPSRAPLPRCERCGELIGVYEPFIVAGPDGWRTTSLAAEPDLVPAELDCRHPACVTSDVQAG